ncbi:MAG: hypothetical protein ACR2IK_23025 [Chloroflexota bacterium]
MKRRGRVSHLGAGAITAHHENGLSYPIGTIRNLALVEVESVYAATATHVHAPHQRSGVGVVSLTLARGVLATITVGRLPAAGAPTSGVFSVRMHVRTPRS